MHATWPVRVALLVALVVVLYVVLRVFYYEPNLLPLVLVVTVCMAVSWLIVDVLGDLGPDWQVTAPTPSVAASQDARLATYVRIVEGHLTANIPDDALRDRLRSLADQRLAQRHGLDRIDPEGRALLGPDLLGVLEGPPRRLGPPEIDRHLRRIEEL